MYIGTGILKVCVNAEIRHKRLQKVELGSRNAKKLKNFISGIRKPGNGSERFQYGRALSHYSQRSRLLARGSIAPPPPREFCRHTLS